MKTKLKYILAITGLIILMSACSHDPQPPKTSDSDSNYTLPIGTLPTQEELDMLTEIRSEYENSLK